MRLFELNAARQFAENWINAWNRHDLDGVLSHYADDFEFASPLIADIAGAPDGTLKGKATVRAYWTEGLRRIPDLHFELVDVLAGVDQVILYYRGNRGMVTESLVFGHDGRVIRAAACYGDVSSSGKTPLTSPALDPATVPARTTSIYPTAEMRRQLAGRSKQALGDVLGLQNFGVNLVTLETGALSALRHWHTRQDEFIYVLEGVVTLVTENGEQALGAGMCAGFSAGQPDGHQLINRGDRTAVYLEVGDRLPGDHAHYPDEDLQAAATRGAYEFRRKDGMAY